MARYEKGSTPKLTETLIENLAASIRSGCYVETAVAMAGISKQAFYRWLKQAEGDESTELTKKLSDAVKKAMAEAEIRDLSVIDVAAQQGQWQAAAWRLERKHPERWGRQGHLRVEHSGPQGKPIAIEAKRENLKRIISDPNALSAIETLEAKLDHEDES